jgi:hypothetical protein
MITALATIPEARKNGALVYVNEGYLQPSTPLYKTEVTMITLDPQNDCHKISGKLMLKREVVDRVGEASAISYVPSGCKTWTETRDDSAGKRTVYISEQQGKMRLPDGSYRSSSIQAYEFDPNLRAMLDIGVTEWNEQTKHTRKIGDDGQPYGKTVAQLAMEYMKFARQRAETGARLRVVKELTGMPTAFSPTEAAKPLCFARVVQNTDYLLKTPEGRLLAAAQATGTQDVIKDLYGRQALPGQGGEEAPEMRNVTEGEGGEAPPSAGANLAGEAGGDDWANLRTIPAEKPPPDEFEGLSVRLEECIYGYEDKINVLLEMKDGTKINPYEIALAELRDPAATAASRKAMIDRIYRLVKKTEETA